jgi:transglutaminase-like putative cysteine protease
VSSDVQRGTNSLLRAGAGLTAAAVVLAIVVGPNLPQAESSGLVSWRGADNGGGPRTTVSPLVDIQQKLVQQSNVELFTVQSDQRAYWRLTALDEFDGQIWKSDGSYGSAQGGLPTSVDSSAAKNLVQQHYRIGNLNSIWLPAAFEPRSVNNASGDVRYEPATATLIVGNNAPTSNSAAYDIQSDFPVFDPAQLEAANEPVPNAITQRDLGLPADFSPSVAALARQIVADAHANTVYDQAVALQNYFRDNFTYDLNVPPGHGESAIERFLAEKRGYCEQFAGTYAAMARSLGIPARVAVGFTPGEQDKQDPTVYHVLGLNAHAWPEVYIGGQGWVLFEPTPTRGAPFAQQYTGVVEEQATVGGSTVTVPTTTPGATPTTVAPNTATTRPKEDIAAGGSDTSAPEPPFWSTSRFGGKALVTAGGLIVLAVLYVIGILVFWAWYHGRRRRQAVDPDDRVRLAWQELIESLALIGLAPGRSETPAEFGARAASTAQLDGLPELARLLIRSSYAPEGVSDEEAERALELSGHLRAAIRAQAQLKIRGLSAIDPRPYEKRRPVKRTGPTRVHLDAPVIEILRFE